MNGPAVETVSPPTETVEKQVEDSKMESEKYPCTACTTPTRPPQTYTCSCPCAKVKVAQHQPPVSEVVLGHGDPGAPTFFGRIRERSLTFCVDTSGSMYLSLGAVRDQLAEFLQTLATHPLETRFNLVEFSTDVTQWSDKMVKCTPQTVAVATEWIRGLEAKTGTNTLDALMTALSDDLCDAVVLVTDGMPDQNPADILDQVALLAGGRPVHCYYIRNGVDPDDLSTEFLQDLAMETYGSFHVVTVAKHGAVESITPVYQAQAAAERIVRTASGDVCSSNPGHQNRCSVRTSLDQPLEYVVEKVGSDYIVETDHYPDFETRQIFEKKFLVEFGPCKHGKFRETTYQETYLYDLVSLDDALRHSVLVGDKVLSPWEQDAERYAPGTVIEGQERRSSDIGANEEASLVVSLDHDGRSVKLTKDLAVWIPSPLHERITFELKLPVKVRKEIATTENYPLHSLPGYPRSGFTPYPEDYDRFEEVIMERQGVDSGFHEKGLYRPPFFVPLYPVHYKSKAPLSTICSEGVEELIPGTGLTKEQLNEKVVQQLMEHNKMLEEIKKDQAELRDQIIGDGRIEKLLNKRETMDENNLTSTSTKKSVTFDEETKEKEGEAMDSGCSVGDIFSDIDLSDFEVDDLPKDVKRRSESPLRPRSSRQRVRSAGKLPPWKYWKTKPAPSMIESNNFGKYRVGPFRDCLMATPMETRTPKHSNQEAEGETKQVRFSFDAVQQGAHRQVPSITDLTPSVLQRIAKDKNSRHVVVDVEWSDSVLGYVNQAAGHQGEATVRDSMGYLPRPPPAKAEPQRAGIDVSIALGERDPATEAPRNRSKARRQRVIERERTWETTHVEREVAAGQMEKQARQRVLNQIRADWARVKNDQDRAKATLEGKCAVSSELRVREEKREMAADRGDKRIEALRNRRVHIETEKLNREYDMARTEITRQATKEQNQMRHWAKVNSDRMEKEAQEAARDASKQRAQLNRIQHFRDLEAQAQQHKTRTNQVQEQRNTMMRSSIFS